MAIAKATRPETRKARPVAAGRTLITLRLTSDSTASITDKLRAQFCATLFRATESRAALLPSLAFGDAS